MMFLGTSIGISVKVCERCFCDEFDIAGQNVILGPETQLSRRGYTFEPH